MSSFHLLVVYGGCIFRKRDQIKNILKVSDNDNVERLLFHGTSSDVIDAICKHNFDHRCHGKNGTKYGKGSYFAVYGEGVRSRELPPCMCFLPT